MTSTITLDELLGMGIAPRLDHVCKREGKAPIDILQWDVGSEGVCRSNRSGQRLGNYLRVGNIIAGAKTAMRLLQEAE